MPQLSLKYTDKSLLELANTMDGILYNGPRKPPTGLAGAEQSAKNREDGAAALRDVGPASQASFELFLEPVIHEYFRALPAMGAVVTLVKGDEIFYAQGFGITGRIDKVR